MLYRAVSACLVTLGLAVFLSAQEAAQEKAARNTHEGTVVSVQAHKLVMKSKSGKEHEHMVAKNATITCDGKACKLSDLREGLRVRVTTLADDPRTVTRVEALDKQRTFSPGGAQPRDR